MAPRFARSCEVRSKTLMITSCSDACSLQPLVPPGIWHLDLSSTVHGCPQRGERSKIFGLVHGVSQNKYRAVRRFRARCREAAKTFQCAPDASVTVPNNERVVKEKVISKVDDEKIETHDMKELCADADDMHKNVENLEIVVNPDPILCPPNEEDNMQGEFEEETMIPNAVDPTNLAILCRKTLVELGVDADEPDTEEDVHDNFDTFLKQLKFLLNEDEFFHDVVHEELDEMDEEELFEEFSGMERFCDDEAVNPLPPNASDGVVIDNVEDPDVFINDKWQNVTLGEMLEQVDISALQERAGEEFYPAKEILQCLDGAVPVQIKSLFQWMWKWPLYLPEDQMLTLARCKAEDLCLGTNVDEEGAVALTMKLWKSLRSVMMRTKSSFVSSWSASTDTSDDMEKFETSDDDAGLHAKWRPD